uniref:Uncharacterized protein n=1 Tax=Lactuca sativa TaxID=4236 RepID=A0A9R1W7V1_LACSA|nr:hypothetical protein LSAT_V11C200072070 [Lactuca sativa]
MIWNIVVIVNCQMYSKYVKIGGFDVRLSIQSRCDNKFIDKKHQSEKKNVLIHWVQVVLGGNEIQMPNLLVVKKRLYLNLCMELQIIKS